MDFDPTALCPLWDEFIERVSGGDADLASFCQRMVGYGLTGTTREQCFFVLYGSGANGKTVFIETILSVLGEYALSAAFDTFLAKPAGADPLTQRTP